MGQSLLRDTLLLSELAEYLRLSPPAVQVLVERAVLPGEHAQGRWLFRRSQVDRWLDLGMPGWHPSVHSELAGSYEPRPVTLGGALHPGNVLLDLVACDFGEAVERAVAAFAFPPGTDRREVAQAIGDREALCSTVLDHGFALPHTSRTGPRLVAADLVGFVRLAKPLASQAGHGAAMDLLFFVFAREAATHLHLLSRAARLAQEASLARELRGASFSGAVVRLVTEAERRLFAPAA